MPKGFLALLFSISLLVPLIFIGVVTAQHWPQPGAQAWWSPNSGRLWITNHHPGYGYGWTYSYNIIWYENKFTVVHAYQHESYTFQTGYAKWYSPYWSTNFPWPARYIEEPGERGEDEFSVHTWAPYDLKPNTAYYTIIYLLPEDPAVTTANFVLEAELQQRIPFLPVAVGVIGYDELVYLTAPGWGWWG